MSRIQQAVTDYIELRRSMGFKLEREGVLLPAFAALVDTEGNGHIDNEFAVRWATQGSRASPHWGAKRLGMVRLFASYYRAIDPLSEVPSPDLVPYKKQRKPPYIYSDEDIAALLAATASIRAPFLAQTFKTLLGLLSITGMRVGEAIALNCDDIDRKTESLVVRKAKFGKSRLVPLHPTAISALQAYDQQRKRKWSTLKTPSFFISASGSRLKYNNVHEVFVRLLKRAGLADRTTPRRPRIHDLRHSFAVKTVLCWYRAGLEVDARMASLSTYLGHTNPSDTYWYLTATPELLARAAQRLERHLSEVIP